MNAEIIFIGISLITMLCMIANIYGRIEQLKNRINYLMLAILTHVDISEDIERWMNK